jgi:hypothetical protein
MLFGLHLRAMLGFRFLRVAAVALWVYGVLGILVAAVTLRVGMGAMDQAASLQTTLETQRTALVQTVRGMSSTLRNTAGATSDFQKSIETARSSADQASKLANDSAGTFRGMGESLGGLNILGVQPFITLQPEFDNSADQLQLLAISLGSTREALGQNGSDIGRVGGDLGRLQTQLDGLATTLGQPGLLGFDLPSSLRPFQLAFVGLCVLVLVQSVFSLVAGVVLFRLQRAMGSAPLFPFLEDKSRTATTNGVHGVGRVRMS